MAIKKPLIFVFFIFVVLLPFVQSSSSNFMFPTNMVGSSSTTKNIKVGRFGNEDGSAAAGIVEDSAREVPTGPDPLHHNNHPIGH